MSKYLYDCHKCTNIAVNANGEIYCLPMIQGRKGIYIKSGNCGSDFVFDCYEYTTEPRQAAIYEMMKGE